MLKRFALLLVLLIAATGCEPLDGKQGERRYETREYIDALRSRGVTQIRMDRNRKLSERLQAEVTEIYLGNVQLIVVDAKPGVEAQAYSEYFQANKARGDHIRNKGNLLLIAPTTAQPEALDAFESL